MSLDFNTSKVADKTVLTEPGDDGRGDVWSRTTCTILGLMYHTGICEITDKTVDDLWTRADFTQRVFDGPVFMVPFMLVAPVRLTRDDLVAHQGMTTNTFPRTPDPAFRKWVWDLYLDNRERLAERDAANAAAVEPAGEGEHGTYVLTT